MRVRGLDQQHDWTFGAGRSNYLGRSEAIAQCVKTALLSLYGNWFLDLTHGVRWPLYLRKNPDLRAMEQELKRVILSVDGVIKIIEFDVSLDPNTRKCVVSVTYLDQFNEQESVVANVTDNEYGSSD